MFDEGMFDFDNDGKLDINEKAVAFATFMRILEEAENGTAGTETSIDDSDEVEDDLADADLEMSELEMMDDELAAELEDSEFDMDDYDF